MNYTVHTLLSGVGANSNGNELAVDGALGGAVVVHVHTIGSGQVRFEGTLDGRRWGLVQATNLSTGTAVTSTTSSGIFRIEATGLAGVRTPNAGWTTGTVGVIALPQFG